MARIEMTRTVKIVLYGLRIYLVVLLLLIGLKFVRDSARSPKPAPAPAAETQTDRSAAAGRRESP